MKFSKVLTFWVGQECPRSTRTHDVYSLDEPRQPPSHGIENLHLCIKLLPSSETAPDEDTLQHAFRSPYLQHQCEDARVHAHSPRAKDVSEREWNRILDEEPVERTHGLRDALLLKRATLALSFRREGEADK